MHIAKQAPCYPHPPKKRAEKGRVAYCSCNNTLGGTFQHFRAACWCAQLCFCLYRFVSYVSLLHCEEECRVFFLLPCGKYSMTVLMGGLWIYRFMHNLSKDPLSWRHFYFRCCYVMFTRAVRDSAACSQHASSVHERGAMPPWQPRPQLSWPGAAVTCQLLTLLGNTVQALVCTGLCRWWRQKKLVSCSVCAGAMPRGFRGWTAGARSDFTDMDQIIHNKAEFVPKINRQADGAKNARSPTHSLTHTLTHYALLPM